MHPHPLPLFGSAGALMLVLGIGTAAEPVATINIGAGGSARMNSPVAFAVPPEMQSARLSASDSRGQPVPLQLDANGTGWLLVRDLPARSQAAIQLHRRVPDTPEGISVHRVGRKVEVWQGRRRVMDYQAEPGELPRGDIDPAFVRGGYLHPIMTPSGTVITDDFPPNHIHHHGIWFPWTKTRFEDREPDFWNMGQKKGRVEFVRLDRHWSGPVHGGFVAEHRFVDLLAPEGKMVLNETWQLRTYPTAAGDRQVWMFDLESTQTCATDSPLLLPEYHYGGLGFRGHWDWNGAANTRFLTSNGETDRVKGHATRANWCFIGGETGGRPAGIAILCHPDNFRAPQPMRLHPTEPFFCFAPQQLGDMSIEPGKPYVSRYRFIVMDGAPDRAQIDAWWRDYAEPPKVEVTWTN